MLILILTFLLSLLSYLFLYQFLFFSYYIPTIHSCHLLLLIYFSPFLFLHSPLFTFFLSVFFTDLEPLKLAPGTSFHEYETKQKRKREGKVEKNNGNEFSPDSSIPEKKVLACVNNTESSADFLKNLLNEQNIPTSETKGNNSFDNSIKIINNNTNNSINSNSNYVSNSSSFQNNVNSYIINSNRNNNVNSNVNNNVNYYMNNTLINNVSNNANNYYDNINNSGSNRNGNNIDIHNNQNSNNINKYQNDNTSNNSSSSSHNNIHSHNINYNTNNYNNNNYNSYNNNNNEANTANRINKITQSSDSILSSYGGAVVLPIHGQVGQAGSTGQNFQPPKFPYHQNTVPPPPFIPPPNLRDTRDTRYTSIVSGQAQGSGKSVHTRSQEYVSRSSNQGKYNQ